MKINQTFGLGVLGLAIGITISLSGCSSMTDKKTTEKKLTMPKMPWSKDKKPEPYPNPARMAVTWTPDTLVQTGRTPTRGFGGRLFFYDDKTKAVPVEGELTVHAFAETSDGSEGEVKRYHFTAEQFTQHFSQSDIGASYSVWIPWDAVGGDQMRISLVPSFQAKSGRMIQGDQALVGLPGKRSSVENIASRPSAAELLQSTRGDGRSGLVTTTIPVKSALPRADAKIDSTAIARRSIPPTPVQSRPAEMIATTVDSVIPPAPLASQAFGSIEQYRPVRPSRLGGASSPSRDVVPASASEPLR